MKNVTRISAGIAIVVFAAAMSQCSKKNYSSPNPAPDSVVTAKAKVVSLRNDGTLGSYLVDSGGHTLYTFANDADGKNNCSGGCATSWPAYDSSGLTADLLGAGLDLSDFGSTPSSTGGTQLTYKGWPLYTFSPPAPAPAEQPGQISGEGIAGIWFVAKPDYSIMLANFQLVGKDGNHYKSDYTAGDGKTIYFTDAWGRTLYAFLKDSAGLNKYTNADLLHDAIWPVYENGSGLSCPSVINKTDVSSAPVFGKTQLDYKGWPLYYFAADSGRRARNTGITVGSAAGSAGEVWAVMVEGIGLAPRP